MAEQFSEPTSPIGRRILKRATRAVVGNPEILSLDLAPLAQPLPVDKTSAGDDPALRNAATARALRKQLNGNAADQSRLARYRDYEAMYDRTPEAHRIIKIVVGMVFGGKQADSLDASAIDRAPFHLVFSSSASDELRQLVESTHQKLNLIERVPQMFQSGQLKGDSFDEIVYSLVSMVADKPHRAADCSVVSDQFNRVKAYRVRTSTDDVLSYSAAGSGTTVTLSPMQMVHYAPSRRLGYRYGESLFHSMRGLDSQYNTTNDMLHVLAVLQGSQRSLMSYEVPHGWTDTQLKRFLRKIRAWNADPTFMDSDGNFMRKIAGLLDYSQKIIPYRKGQTPPAYFEQGAPPFEALLALLKFDQNRFYLGTGVPKALSGLLEDAKGSRSALREQALHFVTQVRHWQKDAALLVLEYLIRAAIAAEIELSPDDIQVRMNEVSDFSEELRTMTMKLRAETAEILGRTGVPMRWIAEHILKVPPHQMDDFLLAVDVEDVGDETDPTQADAQEATSRLGRTLKEAKALVELTRPVVATLEDLAAKWQADYGGRPGRTP